MKGIKLILSVCLAVPFVLGARADTDGDAARAAARRGASPSTSLSRQKSTSHSTGGTTTSARDSGNVASRAVTTGPSAPTATQSRSAINTSPRENAVASRSATTATVTSRTGTANVAPRASAATRTSIRAKAAGITPSRAATEISSRGANTTRQSRAATTGAQRAATASGTTARRASVASTTTRQSRSATTATTTDAAPGNYKECRTVYYECMDEFCANKDTQLKRCACSARMSEFDGMKQQMTQIEDKLLDFNQRLLTVNMDKEDAAAINTATEGELAFNTADKSDSKKMLDEISSKLNNTFKNSQLDNNLSAISLSLDMDSAFDNLDSMMGASTVTKSGTQLYSAALPVCREMAAEVCSDDELAIAESGYQMMIEQDCNTVARAYSNQAETAREKIREGGALLDMSRLNIHQTRNSDDILTCKAKMLDMLSDTTVCGENLGKCLDTSGQYIDPSTGQAFLSANLSQLAKLITRPTADQKWTSVPGNEKFVTFLNTKKKFLAPAMEKCQDIADTVWDEFIEDALAQIKLAQNAKLEDMRQSCTQLVAQCMNDTAKSINEFDARALSTFGVKTDKTVREMCSQVQSACTTLLKETNNDDDWGTGIDNIATDKSYETLLYTCREVGKNCIIQTCKSTSGNFGLCTDIQTSVNRKSIVNRSACWAEVKHCIEQAGPETLAKIKESLEKKGDYNNNFYNYLYNVTVSGDGAIKTIPNETPAAATEYASSTDKYNSIFDTCAQNCSGNNANSDACFMCRLTERVWGNCEQSPDNNLTNTNDTNRILMTGVGRDGTDTLLSWFASSTNTQNEIDSCRDTTCGQGMIKDNKGACVPAEQIDSTETKCTATNYRFDVYESNGNKFTNCCQNVAQNTNDYARCGNNNDGTWVKLLDNSNTGYFTSTQATAIRDPFNNECALGDSNCVFMYAKPSKIYATYKANGDKIYHLICVGTQGDVNALGAPTYCDGEYFIVRNDGFVFSPKTVVGDNYNQTGNSAPTTVSNYFKYNASKCEYNATTGWPNCKQNIDNDVQDNAIHWITEYK